MEDGAVGHNFERVPRKDHPSQIWLSGFRGEDLTVIFFQNIPNLHNQYKSAVRKISQKNLEYILIAMQLQLKFVFILIHIKAALVN